MTSIEVGAGQNIALPAQATERSWLLLVSTRHILEGGVLLERYTGLLVHWGPYGHLLHGLEL